MKKQSVISAILLATVFGGITSALANNALYPYLNTGMYSEALMNSYPFPDNFNLNCAGKPIINGAVAYFLGVPASFFKQVLGQDGTYTCQYVYLGHDATHHPVTLNDVADFTLILKDAGIGVSNFHSTGSGSSSLSYYNSGKSQWLPNKFTITTNGKD